MSTTPNNSVKILVPIHTNKCNLHLLSKKLHFFSPNATIVKLKQAKCRVVKHSASGYIDISKKHSHNQDLGNIAEEGAERLQDRRHRELSFL